MSNAVTMLELVTTIADHAASDGEIVARVTALVSSGAVRLCGTFRGARLDLEAEPAAGGAHRSASR